jgi:hypothetical protein
VEKAEEIGADLKLEADRIMGLDPYPSEALYQWINQTIGISNDEPESGLNSKIYGVPAFLDLETRRCYVAAVPSVGRLLRYLDRPLLCGIAKFERETGKFIEAIPLDAWPVQWRETISSAIGEAFARADADYL